MWTQDSTTRWIHSNTLQDLDGSAGGLFSSQNTIYGENFQLENQLRTRYWVKRAHKSGKSWVDVQELVKESDAWHSAWQTWNATRQNEDFEHIHFASYHEDRLVEEITEDGTFVTPKIYDAQTKFPTSKD